MSIAGQVDEKADPPLEVELHKGQTEFDTTCQVSSVANITRHVFTALKIWFISNHR